MTTTRRRLETRITDRLLAEHRPLLDDALSCADVVAAGWDEPNVRDGMDTRMTRDRSAVVDPYRLALERAGLFGRLVEALEDAIGATDAELAARPVPDVPYLAITGRGVVLRGPIESGRIVVTLAAFEVDPYRRGPPLPDCLDVRVRGRSNG